MMNGYDEKRHLDEDPFAAKGNIVSAFDAFRTGPSSIPPSPLPNKPKLTPPLPFIAKSKPQYVTHTSSGGKWTVAMICISLVLVWTELARWWRGEEQHTFAVEKGVSHILPINLDIVIRMRCADLHVNVQDAAGDRILAAERLTRDPTAWAHWVDAKGMHRLGRDAQGRVVTGEGYAASVEHDEGFGEEHVHDIVALGRRRAKWSRTPRLWGAEADSCRIYGSLELNKVQGDFHITARGHGYMEFGEHLDHKGTFTPSPFPSPFPHLHLANFV
jgi:hypothetical protein